MPAIQLKWSTLFKLTELEFIPEYPKVLKLLDELSQDISWLTAATNYDRRLLRCTEQGALLVADAWSNLYVVYADALYPSSDNPDSVIGGCGCKGVLVATSYQLVKVSFVQVLGGDAEDIYIAPSQLYWYPHNVYSVTATVVPATGGTASHVGVTAFS